MTTGLGVVQAASVLDSVTVTVTVTVATEEDTPVTIVQSLAQWAADRRTLGGSFNAQGLALFSSL